MLTDIAKEWLISQGEEYDVPGCNDTGGYPAGDPKNPDHEQCEFCWTNGSSKFMICTRIRAGEYRNVVN